MEKIPLSANHKRSVTSSLYIIENLVDEIENKLIHSQEKSLTEITMNNKSENIRHYLIVIRKIKSDISFLKDKYNLQPYRFTFSQIINSRKSKIWEVLCDTKSDKLKRGGDFPQKYAQEFDSDMDKLLELTESI